MPEPQVPRGARPRISWLLQAASLVIVVAGLRAAAPFVLPLLLALFLALVSFPIVAFLCRRGARLTLAVLATVLLEAGVLIALGLVITPSLNAFVGAVPGYIEQLNERIGEAIASLQARGIELGDVFTFEGIDAGQLVDVAGGVVRRTLSGVASAVSFAFLVFFLLIFVLLEGGGMPGKLRAAFGANSRAGRYLAGVVQEVQHYLGVKTAASAITGLVVGIGTWALGLPYAPVFGLVAYLLNYIPTVGSIIASVPAVIVALVQIGPGRAALVAVLYIAVNVCIGNFLEPTWMGRRFGLSTLVVFLSLIFWGWVWGPLGMLLSVPLTMMIKIAMEETEGLQWAAVLLGRARPMPQVDEREPTDDSDAA